MIKNTQALLRPVYKNNAPLTVFFVITNTIMVIPILTITDISLLIQTGVPILVIIFCVNNFIYLKINPYQEFISQINIKV